MASLERMNQALAYIEENLADEIDFKQVERLALCSEYHFRRMFSFLAGVSLSEISPIDICSVFSYNRA